MNIRPTDCRQPRQCCHIILSDIPTGDGGCNEACRDRAAALMIASREQSLQEVAPEAGHVRSEHEQKQTTLQQVNASRHEVEL